MIRDDDLVPFRRGLRALRRRWILVLAAGFLTGCLMGGFALVRAESFRSTALVMIDTRIRPEGELTSGTGFVPTSVTAIESELEVLRSKDVLERVVRRLDLTEDPRLTHDGDETSPPGPRDLPEMLRALLAGPADAPADLSGEATDWQLENAVERLRKLRSVEQVGVMSSVYAVSVEHENRYFAAELANAIATEYVALKKEQKIGSLDAVYGWLSERSAELGARLQALERELQSLVNEPIYDSESMRNRDMRRLLRLRETADGSRTEEMDAIEARFEAHVTQEAELRRIESQIEATLEAFTTIQTQIQTQRESSALSDDVKVVGAARPALESAGPRKRMASIAGFLLGAALAAAVIALREVLAAPLRTAGDIRPASDSSLYAPEVGHGAGGLRRLVRGLAGALDTKAVPAPRIIVVTAPREDDAALAVGLGLLATYDARSENALLVADAAHRPLRTRRPQPVPTPGNAADHLGSVRPEPLTDRAAILPLDFANESIRDSVMSGDLRRWLQRHGDGMDRIVLLIPPVLAESDLTALGALADSRLLVLECDRTRLGDIDAAAWAMRAAGAGTNVLVMIPIARRTLRSISERLFTQGLAWEAGRASGRQDPLQPTSSDVSSREATGKWL